MKYCKHLKKRKNKPYCNLLKQEITLSQCRECVNKEYRFPVKWKIENRKNVKISNKKSTIFVKNGTFYTKNTQNNGKNSANLEYNSENVSNNHQMRNSAYSLQNSAKTLQKMKTKSNKLANLERKRFSVFTDNMDKCYFCDNTRMDKHEIYRGKNRTNSMKFGFVLPLCRVHHNMYQDDVLFNKYWHEFAQKFFEEHYGTREEFISIFRKNYLN